MRGLQAPLGKAASVTSHSQSSRCRCWSGLDTIFGMTCCLLQLRIDGDQLEEGIADVCPSNAVKGERQAKAGRARRSLATLLPDARRAYLCDGLHRPLSTFLPLPPSASISFSLILFLSLSLPQAGPCLSFYFTDFAPRCAGRTAFPSQPHQ